MTSEEVLAVLVLDGQPKSTVTQEQGETVVLVTEEPPKPFAVKTPTNASGIPIFKTAGPRGPEGPEGPAGPVGELDVDPVLSFENALI